MGILIKENEFPSESLTRIYVYYENIVAVVTTVIVAFTVYVIIKSKYFLI